MTIKGCYQADHLTQEARACKIRSSSAFILCGLMREISPLLPHIPQVSTSRKEAIHPPKSTNSLSTHKKYIAFTNLHGKHERCQYLLR